MKRRDAMLALGVGAMCPMGAWSAPPNAGLRPDAAQPEATRVMDLAQARALQARWAGRPYVLHAWGLHCPACVKGLPGWRDIVSGTPGLPLLLIQVDAVPDAVAATAERLRQVGLVARESWTVHDELDEFTRHALDARWLGETPFTLLSTPDGRVERVRGPVQREAVRAWWQRAKALPTPRT